MVDTNMQIVVRHPIEPDIAKLTFIKGLMDETTMTMRTVKRERRRKTTKSFKTWCMPVEQSGYIKCRKHDFL